MEKPQIVATIYMAPLIPIEKAVVKVNDWLNSLEIPAEFGDLDISVEEIWSCEH